MPSTPRELVIPAVTTRWRRTCPWWMTWMFGRSVRKTLNPEGGGGGGEGEERGGGWRGAISTEERVQRGPNNWPHQGQPPILSAIQRATPKSNTIGEISLACHSKSLIFFSKQHLSPLPNHSENHAPWSSFSFYNFCKRLPCLLTGKEWACTKIIWLTPCQKWPYTHENGCWLPQSDHIHRQYPFPDQEWGMIGRASVLHSWQWVLFFLKSCWITQKSSFSSCKIWTTVSLMRS